MHWTEIMAFVFLGVSAVFALYMMLRKKKDPGCSCHKGDDLVEAYHKKYKKCDCEKCSGK